MQNRRRHRKTMDMTQLLILVICVLVVMLVIVLGVAIFMGIDRPDTGSTDGSDNTTQSSGIPDDTGSTGDTGATGGTTVPPTDYIGLSFTSPETTELTTIQQTLLFTGLSDPKAELTVNGQKVERQQDGSFSYTAELVSGTNTFTFAHKEERVTYTVEHRYTVESFRPSAGQTYNSGATVYFEVSAREGSVVQASFNGQTISLKPAVNQTGSGAAEGFMIYTGSYALPSLNTSDLALGKITYTAVCDGVTETYTSGEITCLKSTQVLGSDPSVTPAGGKYIDVGSGYICEIINYSAETYSGFTVDDNSSPVHNYLPQGTLDYCATEKVNFEDNQYMLLRCGRRVYVKKNNPPYQQTQVVDCYVGTLPDHNELGFVSMENTGRYTVLTLNSLWKAPFLFELLPQQFTNSSGTTFPVVECTYSYIDITFCYATQFTGEVKLPENDPLFSGVELIRRDYDCTLRLYLKQTGVFYGWDAYYNENDQLCFKFLNPAKVMTADNNYGADLTGVRIMIDVGHGGVDGGATRYDANGVQRTEAERNLALSMALKTELESMGATVLMNRYDNSTVSVDERIQLMRRSELDYLIAVHHNSSSSASSNGFEVYYYASYSKAAANMIYDTTVESGAYQNYRVPNWHVYYMGRQSYCPVVLTENGYMSNAADLAAAVDPAIVTLKAQAMAQGIANYFLANSPK